MSRIPDTETSALLSAVVGGGGVAGLLLAAAAGLSAGVAGLLSPAAGFLLAAATGCSWVMVVINDSFRGRRWPEFGRVKMSSWRGAGNARPRGRMIFAGRRSSSA